MWAVAKAPGVRLRVEQTVVIAAATLVGWSALAQETASPVSRQGESADVMIDKGKTLYVRHCIHCHGINMVTQGTVAFDLRKFPQNDEARFVQSVTHGKNDRMPPWGDVLTRQEIEELWAYVRSGGAS
jgi:cytochrome c55X